jgi:hypothetical protein
MFYIDIRVAVQLAFEENETINPNLFVALDRDVQC